MQISYSLTDIQTAVHQFWQYAHQFRVITFNGGLGAGKTTFIRALCSSLGVEDAVSSPTFSLINEYHLIGEDGNREVIYHSDWYRLRDEEEAIQAGIEDMLTAPRARFFIEWAERAPGLLPAHYLRVDFTIGDNDTRTITLVEH